MSQLPQGWTKSKLGNFVKLKNGFAFKSKDYVDAGDSTAPVIRISDIQNGKASIEKASHVDNSKVDAKFLISKGDLLIAMSGATTGKTGIFNSNDKAYQNQRVGNLLLNDNKSSCPRYRNYLIQSLQQDILKKAYGAAQPNISAKDLAEIEINLAPFEEQKRIADKLDSVLTKVEAAQARLDKIPTILKRFRQSVLAAATSGELTKDWRLENDVNSWESTKVGNLLDNGPQNGIYKPSTFYGSGTKIIRIDGFYDGQLVDWNTIKRVNLEENELEKWKLKPDDILINRVNSIEYLGKCGHVKKLPEDAVFESNIMRISLKSDVLPEYLTYFLSSPIGLQRLRDNAKHAVNQASINQNDVKSVIFEKPSISEQKIIISKLSELLGHAIMIEKQYKAAKVRLDKLTQSILAKAFRGELLGTTVQQIESELKQSMIDPVLR